MKIRSLLFTLLFAATAMIGSARGGHRSPFAEPQPAASSPTLRMGGDFDARLSLGEFAREMGRGIFLVGNPESGTGTAWCVSKKDRLLVTNAHVADMLSEGRGELVAIAGGTSHVYRVVKTYYHPGVRRYKSGAEVSIPSIDPSDGEIDSLSPDVALLQLEADGPDLSVEFAPATSEELKTLFAQPAAIYGFPGYDNFSWPKQGSKPAATFHDGVISRITNFDLDPDAPFEDLQDIQYTMGTWGGYSGSPVFLPSGRVCAIHNMGRKVESRGVVQSMPHGIRIDCLLELLIHHKLDAKMPFAVDRGAVNVDRFLNDEQPNEKRDDEKAGTGPAKSTR